MRKHIRHGFTLVELLVVCAIIVVLMTILLPSLQHAVETAKVATCGSNLRQIAIAHRGYVVDNSDSYPLQCYGQKGYQNTPADNLYQRAGDASSWYWPTPGDPTAPWQINVTWDVIMQPYLNSWKVLMCPSDRISYPCYAGGTGLVFRSYGLTNNTSWWLIQSQFVSPVIYDKAPKDSMYPDPSDTILATETVQYQFAANNLTQYKYWNIGCNTSSLGVGMIYRHNYAARANFLFLDGHVEPRNAVVVGGVPMASVYPKFPGYSFSSPTTSGFDGNGNYFVNIQQSFCTCGNTDPYPGK